jgi:hypothetical protein
MPEPVALVTVIQVSLLTAVHVHCVPETTDNEPVVAVWGTETVIGVTVDVHCASAARTSSVRAIATMIQQYRNFIRTGYAAGDTTGYAAGCIRRAFLKSLIFQ